MNVLDLILIIGILIGIGGTLTIQYVFRKEKES